MADDLNQPYIGYRSAGRRRPELNDRAASANAPLAALRGLASGVLGAPGDIESLVRMLPGLSEQTFLPTSEDIERRLPLRSVSETPVGRAATGAGQIGGGFYTGPGSPLRAIAGLPSAVSRAGRDFVMAAGQPAVNVVKPKGGNFLAGTIERVVEPMKTRVVGSDPAARLRDLDAAYAQNVEAGVAIDPAVFARERARLEPEAAMNRWLETKLGKYMRNEMATPEDPLRALAERGVLHYDPTPTGYSVSKQRIAAGFPEEGMAQSDLAKRWEKRADTFFNELQASDLTRGYPELVEKDPWLAKVPPETRVYELLGGANEELGMQHLVDELKNAINPASGLPENLRLKYSDLEKVTVPQAVERVAKINEWRAAQKAEADMARAMNPATHLVKEYPDQGFKWVELKTGDLPEGWTQKNSAFYDPNGERHVHPGAEALADALKYEGETMGHCVGGYCPDVLEGLSRIYSLRDKKGQPHVTIEVRPANIDHGMWYQSQPQEVKDALEAAGYRGYNIRYSPQFKAAEASAPEEIVQIKGKANRAPNPEYLPAVQDFVRSQNWSNVGDLKNAGLVDLHQAGVPAEMRGGQRFVTEDEYKDIVRKNAEGFALGGLVQKYADGGLVGSNLGGSNIYNSDAMQDPASAYRFADGGQAGDVRAYASGGLVQKYADGGAVNTSSDLPVWDFEKIKSDANAQNLNVASFLARNWGQIGKYNKTRPLVEAPTQSTFKPVLSSDGGAGSGNSMNASSIDGISNSNSFGLMGLMGMMGLTQDPNNVPVEDVVAVPVTQNTQDTQDTQDSQDSTDSSSVSAVNGMDSASDAAAAAAAAAAASGTGTGVSGSNGNGPGDSSPGVGAGSGTGTGSAGGVGGVGDASGVGVSAADSAAGVAAGDAAAAAASSGDSSSSSGDGPGDYRGGLISMNKKYSKFPSVRRHIKQSKKFNFASGGLVANSHTADFDPARIDAIVGDLNALNAG